MRGCQRDTAAASSRRHLHGLMGAPGRRRSGERVRALSQRSRARWAPIAWASGIGTALPICRAMATFDPTHL